MRRNSYVVFYTYWIIGQLQVKTDDLELIMDLALIIMTFLEVGFIPYTMDDSTREDDNGLDFFKNTRKFRNSITPKTDKLINANQSQSTRRNTIRLRKYQNKSNANLPENLFETKKMLEKEHLLRINRLVHYWDIISIVFGELDT
jgi:hypothetical protein